MTIAGGRISPTPSVVGDQPASYTDASGKTVVPLGDISDDAYALLASLDATQQAAAVLGTAVIDVVLGPGQDGKTIATEGLLGSKMTAAQQAALLKLIMHYAEMVNDAETTKRLAEIKADLANTAFAWFGPTAAGSSAYFRVTGPTVVVEYSPQGAGRNATATTGAPTHTSTGSTATRRTTTATSTTDEPQRRDARYVDRWIVTWAGRPRQTLAVAAPLVGFLVIAHLALSRVALMAAGLMVVPSMILLLEAGPSGPPAPSGPTRRADAGNRPRTRGVEKG